jgi:hypothetical protein
MPNIGPAPASFSISARACPPVRVRVEFELVGWLIGRVLSRSFAGERAQLRARFKRQPGGGRLSCYARKPTTR